jgi:hypothetical protein
MNRTEMAEGWRARIWILLCRMPGAARCGQALDAEHVERASEVVGQAAQGKFRPHHFQPAAEEGTVAEPELERAKGMLGERVALREDPGPRPQPALVGGDEFLLLMHGELAVGAPRPVIRRQPPEQPDDFQVAPRRLLQLAARADAHAPSYQIPPRYAKRTTAFSHSLLCVGLRTINLPGQRPAL